MNKREQAEIFAYYAHDGQYRKGEIGKGGKIPYIVHPLEVAKKLEKFNFEEEIIIAGLLHDIAEDTNFTLKDIEKLFGKKIASLVKGDTEEDKTLSWKERKQRTIDRIRELDIQHKAVVCCDKCSNLEGIYLLAGKKGYLDFKDFKGEIEQYKWYYNSLYDSLIYAQDKNQPMFRELKNLITIIFENDTTFTKDYQSILRYKRLELIKLKQLFDINYLEVKQLKSLKKIDQNSYPYIKYFLDSMGITGFCYDESNIEHNYNANDVIDELIDEFYCEMLTEIDRKIQLKKRMKIK